VSKHKRHHHTVPRFYLNRFADDTRHVMRVALPGDKRRSISTTDAAVVKDFYLVQAPDGTWSDAVEDMLADLESRAAPAFQNLVDHRRWPIDRQARETISSWAAAQYLRTTAARQVGDDLTNFVLKLAIVTGGRRAMRDALEQIEQRAVDDEDVDEAWALMTRFQDYKIQAHQNFHIETILRLLPPTAASFQARGWNIVRFTRKTLITTDAPVVPLNPPGSGHHGPVGLATAAGLLLPLDRHAALIMGQPHATDEETPGTAALARTFNQILAANAHRCVFHHPDDTLNGIDLPDSTGPQISTIDPATLLPNEEDPRNTAPSE
jgi:hypothetical protein